MNLGNNEKSIEFKPQDSESKELLADKELDVDFEFPEVCEASTRAKSSFLVPMNR